MSLMLSQSRKMIILSLQIFTLFALCHLARSSFLSPFQHRTQQKQKLLQNEYASSLFANNAYTRRDWLGNQTTGGAAISMLSLFIGATTTAPLTANAEFDPDLPPDQDPELQEYYNNPNIPAEPEERSGLIVLRVAEVAEFQEKILRAVVSGDLGPEISVSPQQIAFGTRILLRNSNLDGNLKLMVNEEIPKKLRKEAIRNAVKTMNTIQDIAIYAGKIQRPFEAEEMLELADMYRSVKIQLNQMYEYLPPKEKEKYYGYFVAVTEYEKKIANGTYNPDIDGILNYD